MSFVPVMSNHGIFTSANAVSALERDGALGLNAIAALMRGSVSFFPIIGKFSPLTACVVIAPKEWPDIPIFFRSMRPVSD
jgi:hypothetical protein